MLTHPESRTKEFICICFSPDSKYLVTLGSAPNFIMLYWAWEKSQGPMASVRCSSEADAPVYRVTVNPQDNTNVCVSGLNALKMYRYTEGNFKQLAFQKVEENVLCQAWLPDDGLVCGTESGKVLLFQNHELKSEIRLHERLTSLAALANGFLCGTASGNVLHYARTDNKDYALKREVAVPSEPGRIQAIHHFAVSPSEESMLCSTSMRQLYTMTLTDGEPVVLQVSDRSFIVVLPKCLCFSGFADMMMCLQLGNFFSFCRVTSHRVCGHCPTPSTTAPLLRWTCVSASQSW